MAFETATREAGHGWIEVDLTDTFATWLASDEYRDAYFENPGDLQLKLEAEFADVVAARIRETLLSEAAGDDTVVSVFGVASIFGFTRLSRVLELCPRTRPLHHRHPSRSFQHQGLPLYP